MSTAFDIVGFDSTWKTPKFAARIDYVSGSVSAGDQELAVLCSAQKTSTGDLTLDGQPRRVQSVEDVDARAGAGSELALQGYAALYAAQKLGGTVPVYLQAVTENSAGTKATATFAFAFSASLGAWDSATAYAIGDTVTAGGVTYRAIATSTNQTPPNATYWVVQTAASAGTLTLWMLGNQYVNIGISQGDSLATIEAAFKTAVNNKTRWPVTCGTVASNVHTLTCKNYGAWGRSLIFFLDQSLAPSNLAVTMTGSATVGDARRIRMGASSTGTLYPDYTLAIAQLTTKRYARIAPAANDTTNAALWKSAIAGIGSATSMIYDMVIYGTNDSNTTAITLSNAVNDFVAQVIANRNGESPPCQVAAVKAVVRAMTEQTPGVPDYDGLAGKGYLPGIAPCREGYEADLYTDTDTNTLLNNGVTPVNTFGDEVRTVRSITSYSFLPSTPGVADFRCLDIGDPVVAQYIALDAKLDWVTNRRVANPYVDDDPPLGGPSLPSGVDSPRGLRSWLMKKLQGHFAGLLIQDPSLNPPTTTITGSTGNRWLQAIIPVVPRQLNHKVGVILKNQSSSQ